MFKEVVDLNENHYEAFNFLARCCQERNIYIYQESSEFSYKEALILEKLGMLEEAVSTFTRSYNFNNKNNDEYSSVVKYILILIENYIEEGDKHVFTQAKQFYDKALSCYFRFCALSSNKEVNIEDIKLKIHRKIILILEKYHSEFKNLNEKELDKFGSFELYIILIKLWNDIKEKNREIKDFLKTFVKDSETPNFIVEFLKHCFKRGKEIYRGNKYEGRKYFETGKRFLELIKIHETDILDNLIVIYLDHAKYFQDIKLFYLAMYYYERYTEHKKNKKEDIDIEIYKSLLYLYSNLGYEENIDKMTSSNNFDLNVEALYQKAVIKYKNAKNNESLQISKGLFEKVIEMKRDHAGSLCILGYIMHCLGREREALRKFEESLLANPFQDIALNGKVVALLYLENHEEALEHFEKAIKINPILDVAYYNMGIVYYESGDIEIAMTNFNQAIEINPTVIYHCHRAQISYAIGDIKRALYDFQQAAKLIKGKSTYSSNLTIENKKDIIKYLWEERMGLIGQLVEKQELLSKINEKYTDAEMHIEKIAKSSDTIKRDLHSLTCRIITDLTKRNTYFDDDINTILYKETGELKFKLDAMIMREKELLSIIDELKKEKVSINRIEKHVFVVSKEITDNEYLYQYYSALYDKLISARDESSLIATGNLSLQLSNIKTTIISTGINCIPVVGKYLSSGFEATSKLIKSNDIKTHAARMKDLIKNPDDMITVFKKTTEKLTLMKKEEMLFKGKYLEIEKWKERGLTVKCQDFFIVNMNDHIYKSNAEILGCIDALKIVLAISIDQVKKGNLEELINQLVNIPKKYKVSDNREIVSNDENESIPIFIGVFDDLDNIEQEIRKDENSSNKTCKGEENHLINNNFQVFYKNSDNLTQKDEMYEYLIDDNERNTKKIVGKN